MNIKYLFILLFNYSSNSPFKSIKNSKCFYMDLEEVRKSYEANHIKYIIVSASLRHLYDNYTNEKKGNGQFFKIALVLMQKIQQEIDTEIENGKEIKKMIAQLEDELSEIKERTVILDNILLSCYPDLKFEIIYTKLYPSIILVNRSKNEPVTN